MTSNGRIATLPMRPVKALRHLRVTDPALTAAMDAVGAFRLPRRPATLHQLCRQIIGQQLSMHVAGAIGRRFTELMGGEGRVTPERILRASDDDLRRVGLSAAKMRTVRELAAFWKKHRLTPDAFPAMHDHEIMELLTQVKGVGPWTVKMFLIFSLARPDVLPQEDLGLRAGLRKIDGLDAHPHPNDVISRTANWSPFSTVATWYCWQYLTV